MSQISHLSPFSPISPISPTPLSHLPLQNGLTAEAVAAASDRGEVYQLLSRLTGEPSDLGYDVRETGATSEEQPLSTTEPDRGEAEVSQPEPNREVKTATHQQPPLPVASRITQVWSCVQHVCYIYISLVLNIL